MSRLVINRPKAFKFKRFNENEALNLPVGYEPIRTNRFKFTFPEVIGINQWSVRAVTRPAVEITNEIYTGGGYVWYDIVVELYDMIGHNSSQILYSWIMSEIDRQRNLEYKLEMLDNTGQVTERWLIQGLITGVDFGELIYDDGDVATIQIIIKPYTCILDL